MNNKVLLSQGFFILIILLIGFYYKKKFKKNDNENLYNINKYKPNYSKENFRIFISNNLNELLNKFNRTPLTFNSECKIENYIQNKTPLKVRLDLRQISEYVLKLLNKKSIFNFNQTNFGNVKVKTDINLNRQYIYELFVRETNNDFSLKLNINVLTFINKKIALKYYKQSDLEFYCKGFKYYPIGIPSLNQLIPTPMSVIPTGNQIISNNGINYPKKDDIRILYINSINIENSTLVLNPNNIVENNIVGIENISLENGPVTEWTSPFIEKSVIRNKWPTLKSKPLYQKAWPCTLPSQDWDELGVSDPEVFPTKLCPGLRSSTKQLPLIPEFWRTLTTIPVNSGENQWLFSLTNASGAVSSSASQPPP